MTTVERAKVEDVNLIRQVLRETWIDTYARYLAVRLDELDVPAVVMIELFKS